MKNGVLALFLFLGSSAFGNWDGKYRGTAEIESKDVFNCSPYVCDSFGIDIKETESNLLVRRNQYECVCEKKGKGKFYWRGIDLDLIFDIKNDNELWRSGKQVGTIDDKAIEYSAFKTRETLIERTTKGVSYVVKGEELDTKYEIKADLE